MDVNVRNAMIGVSLLVCSFASQATVITFDEPGILSTVTSDGIPTRLIGDFYAGDGGPNFGVIFKDGGWIVNSDFGQTSQPYFASFYEDELSFVTVSGGFSGLISFTYGAFVDSIVSIYDGADGTGNLLASINLLANNVYAFDPVSISFSGTGHSIVVVSDICLFGWDDLAFNESSSVPEPGSLALLGLGLAGLTGLRRKQPI